MCWTQRRRKSWCNSFSIWHPSVIHCLWGYCIEITQDQVTPFKDGMPIPSWVEWFCKRNPTISLRVAQRLEMARARGYVRKMWKFSTITSIPTYLLHDLHNLHTSCTTTLQIKFGIVTRACTSHKDREVVVLARIMWGICTPWRWTKDNTFWC